MSDGNSRELRLGEKLWKRIEGPQGFSFVSSDIVEWEDGRVLEFIQNALPDAKRVVRIMESFDKKYHFGDHV